MLPIGEFDSAWNARLNEKIDAVLRTPLLLTEGHGRTPTLGISAFGLLDDSVHALSAALQGVLMAGVE